jgi:hypothetical protein
MPPDAPQYPDIEDEKRLIAYLRGVSGEAAGLRAVAAAGGVAGVVAYRSGDRETAAVQELTHQRALHWLGRVGRALDQVGVRFVALKGAALGERYYRPGYLRACGDIDILIDPGEFGRAEAAVRGLGYRPSAKAPGLTTRVLGHDAAYDHDAAPMLEMHVRLHSFFGIRPDAGRFLDRAVEQRLSNGYGVRVLDPVDEFVHLAAHAAAHRWIEARWAYDLYLLLEERGDLDWEAVARRTGELHLWPAVLLTCAVLETEWERRVPLAELAGAGYGRAVALLPRVRREVWAGTNAAKMRQLWRETVLCEGPAEKVRLLLRGVSYPVLRRLRDLHFS